MPLNDAGKNATLQSGTGGGLGGVVTHLSLHSGDPGTTGANEVTGGTPAYARKAVTWAAAAAGERASSDAQLFDVPSGVEVLFVGLWSALTAGTFYGWFPLNGSARAVGTAGATSDAITSYAHGLANGNRVVVYNAYAESLPTGLVEGTTYFVVGATADTFQVSLTLGGAAVNITADGELHWQRSIPESFGAQGQLNLAAGAAVLSANVV